MRVYTTRQDTLFGATFMVVAPDARLAAELVTDEQRPAYDAYLEQVRKESEIDRLSTERPKTGVFLGVHAVNPANGERIPVWAADYVLADYGTGAIMAVPAGTSATGTSRRSSTCRSCPPCNLPTTGLARPTTAKAPRSTPPTTRSP